MSANKDIRDSIKEMAKQSLPYSVLCKVYVDTIDSSKYNCVPVNGGADIIDVKVQAQTTTGILITPTEASIVIVTLTGVGSGFISMYSDIDSIQLNGSNYDGLVKVNDLVTKLNNLENKVNTIITAYNAHTHIASSFGAPTTTPAAPVAGALTPTVKADLENNLILHGNG